VARASELLAERIRAMSTRVIFLALCGERAGTIKFQLPILWPDALKDAATFIGWPFGGASVGDILLFACPPGLPARRFGTPLLRLDRSIALSFASSLRGFARHHSDQQVGPYFVALLRVFHSTSSRRR
jgi:hypothetical protein